jgi:hypothetical protein
MNTKMGIATLAFLLLVSGMAWAAPATHTPVTGIWQDFQYGPPEKAWMDEEGVQHIRGQASWWQLTEDLTGTGFGIFNLNLNPLTGCGDGSGTMCFDVERDGLRGTFDGRFSVVYTFGWTDGQAVAHGTGAFAGMKLMVEFSGWLPAPTREWAGVILDPNAK